MPLLEGGPKEKHSCRREQNCNHELKGVAAILHPDEPDDRETAGNDHRECAEPNRAFNLTLCEEGTSSHERVPKTKRRNPNAQNQIEIVHSGDLPKHRSNLRYQDV